MNVSLIYTEQLISVQSETTFLIVFNALEAVFVVCPLESRVVELKGATMSCNYTLCLTVVLCWESIANHSCLQRYQ